MALKIHYTKGSFDLCDWYDTLFGTVSVYCSCLGTMGHACYSASPNFVIYFNVTKYYLLFFDHMVVLTKSY